MFSMDDILLQRLAQLQQDQFDALVDEHRLVNLNQDIAKFFEDLETHYKRGLVSVKTLGAANEFASQLEIIVQHLSLLPSDSSTTSEDDIDKMFSGLTIVDGKPAVISSMVPLPYSHSPYTASHHPPSFESMAIKWLATNFINPYPSKKQRANFCTEAGVAAEEVEMWFRDQRRNIGWTALCKDRFGGSKKALKDAWDHVLGCTSLEHDDEGLLASFSSIQHRVDAELASTMSRSQAIVTKPNHMKDVLPDSQGAQKKRSLSADFDYSMEKITKRTR